MSLNKVTVDNPNSENELASLDPKDLKILELNEKIKQLVAHQKNLENNIENIINSKSWKLTAGLRSIVAGVKLFLPLFKNKVTALKACEIVNISENKGWFEVEKSGSKILLKSADGYCPTGWVFVETDIESSKYPAFFLFYFGNKGDYHPVNRTWLTCADRNSVSTLFKIPEWTNELRLDPFNLDIPFKINRFEVRQIGKLQMLWHVLKVQVKPVLKHPSLLFKKLFKLILLLREGGVPAIRARFFRDDFTNNYQEWIRRYDTLTPDDISKIKTESEKLNSKPKFSILMPVYNVAEKWLDLAIRSVLEQVYENWELCIADDASTMPHVRKMLEAYAARDKRIRVVYREKNGHIAEATNSALEIASGEYVALVDNDDELTPHALYMMALEINKYPDAALIYSDEDKITKEGLRFNPYFKPDWNEELFLQQNFICHLGVYKTSVVREVGGFRKESAGAQDWDLALKVIAKAGKDKIRHIPHVLYHWRVIEGSTAQSTLAKPYVLEAQKNSVINYLKSTGTTDAQVEIIHSISQLRVKYPPPAHKPLVSIIIPTKDQCDFLKTTVDSILEKTTYRNFEIIIVNNGSKYPETLQYFSELKKLPNVSVIDDNRPFNFSELNNGAVPHAKGEVLAFLNNDLSVISNDWLDEMLSCLYRPNVGAVGAKLLYPNNAIQHAGVIVGIGGVAGHSHKGRHKDDPGYFNKCILTQEMSAVTAACMIVKKDVFKKVGGFDDRELKVAFNDIDLCLKIRKAGYRIIFNPYAELYHYESVSRGFENTPSKVKRFEHETETMRSRWKQQLENDPFYNPNLTLLLEDFSFSFPPRVKKPWQSK